MPPSKLARDEAPSTLKDMPHFSRIFPWRTRVAVWGLAALFVVACDRPDSASTPEGEAPSDRRPRIVQSDTIPESPKRIVSLAPNLTETLFALGAGDRVVGVTKHCDHPPAARERPVIGSFANPNFEAILARDPDLVVGLVSGGERDVVERLKGVEVPYAFVRMSTVEDVFAGIEALGRIVGVGSDADELIERMRRSMDAIEGAWVREETPRVLLVYGHDPLVAAGPGTFGHQLLVRIGAENVLGGAGARYPRLDGEKLLELAPERIVDTSMIGESGDASFWKNYSALEAVQAGRVVELNDEVVLRPGPRLPEALERMARAVHGVSAESNR